MKYFMVFSLFFLFIFIGPFVSITALNTLFGLGIELSVGTWFAMAWTHLVFTGAKR